MVEPEFLNDFSSEELVEVLQVWFLHKGGVKSLTLDLLLLAEAVTDHPHVFNALGVVNQFD